RQLIGVGFKHLKSLPNLRSLTLGGECPDSTWKHLGELTDLKTLILNDSNITDAGLVPLRTLTKLTAIELHRTQVTDAGLMHLKELPNLISVSIEGAPKVTPAGLDALRKAMPNCVINGKKWEGDTDRRAAEWVLSIGGAVGIRSRGQEQEIRAATELPQQTFQLQIIHLNGNQKVSDAGLANLKGLTSLRDLKLGHTRVSEAGLAHLNSLTQL